MLLTNCTFCFMWHCCCAANDVAMVTCCALIGSAVGVARYELIIVCCTGLYFKKLVRASRPVDCYGGIFNSYVSRTVFQYVIAKLMLQNARSLRMLFTWSFFSAVCIKWSITLFLTWAQLWTHAGTGPVWKFWLLQFRHRWINYERN